MDWFLVRNVGTNRISKYLSSEITTFDALQPRSIATIIRQLTTTDAGDRRHRDMKYNAEQRIERGTFVCCWYFSWTVLTMRCGNVMCSRMNSLGCCTRMSRGLLNQLAKARILIIVE